MHQVCCHKPAHSQVQESSQIRSLAGWLLNSWQNQAAGFSVSPCHPAGKEETPGEGEGGRQEENSEAGSASDPYADLSREQLAGELMERDGALSASAAEVTSPTNPFTNAHFNYFLSPTHIPMFLRTLLVNLGSLSRN